MAPPRYPLRGRIGRPRPGDELAPYAAPDARRVIEPSERGEQYAGGDLNDHQAIVNNVRRRQAEADWHSILTKGSLGRMINFDASLASNTGRAQDVIYVVGPDERSTLLSVTLTIDTLPGHAIPTVRRTFFADLEWGNGGAFARATVDWRLGQCFSLPASALRISARTDVVDSPQFIQLGAFVSLLQVPMSRPPTISNVRPELDAGLSTTVLLSPFVRRLSVQRTPLTSPMRVTFADDLGGNNYFVEVGVGAVMEMMDISNRITNVVITNLGAAAAFTPTLIQELAFN